MLSFGVKGGAKDLTLGGKIVDALVLCSNLANVGDCKTVSNNNTSPKVYSQSIADDSPSSHFLPFSFSSSTFSLLLNRCAFIACDRTCFNYAQSIES